MKKSQRQNCLIINLQKGFSRELLANQTTCDQLKNSS